MLFISTLRVGNKPSSSGNGETRIRNRAPKDPLPSTPNARSETDWVIQDQV